MSGITEKNKNYVGYEYKEVVAESSRVSLCLDSYKNFGWEPDGNWDQTKNEGKVTLHLKRAGKIMNKAELTRLQRHFEDCLNQIEVLEKSKTSMATAVALAIGIIGTAFMAGATFAAVHEPPFIWLCILLAIPGFLGWVIPYFAFSFVVRKRVEIIIPLIEEQYDKIYDICEKGNKLLR